MVIELQGINNVTRPFERRVTNEITGRLGHGLKRNSSLSSPLVNLGIASAEILTRTKNLINEKEFLYLIHEFVKSKLQSEEGLEALYFKYIDTENLSLVIAATILDTTPEKLINKHNINLTQVPKAEAPIKPAIVEPLPISIRILRTLSNKMTDDTAFNFKKILEELHIDPQEAKKRLEALFYERLALFEIYKLIGGTLTVSQIEHLPIIDLAFENVAAILNLEPICLRNRHGEGFIAELETYYPPKKFAKVSKKLVSY